MELIPQFGIPTDPAANERSLRNVGRIEYSTFQGVIGALFGLAVLTVAARMVTRIYTHRRLALDDFFLLFGLASLSGAAGIVFKFTRTIFLAEAIYESRWKYTFSVQDIFDFADATAVVGALACLTWTATFSVKFSFLALFKLLIRRVSKRITIYYWTVVVFTALVWALMVCEPFIFCPVFGLAAVTCLPRLNVFLALNILSTILDITTDIMIASIPILVLRKSQMKPTQKLGLAVFLCLSLFMAMVAVVRMAGYRRQGYPLDATWLIFWLYIEACVATIMASISAFRTLLVHGGSRASKEKKKKKNGVPLLTWSKKFGGEGVDLEDLPTRPSATLVGVKTHIYHSGSTETTASMGSNHQYLDEKDRPYRKIGPDNTDQIDQIHVQHRVEIEVA